MIIEEMLDHIEKEITEIKEMLQTIIEQTAPPLPVKTKMQLRDRARRELAEWEERRKKREENRLKKQNDTAGGKEAKPVKAKKKKT